MEMAVNYGERLASTGAMFMTEGLLSSENLNPTFNMIKCKCINPLKTFFFMS